MATSNSQESELIIRARDLSSEPIAKIAETVKQLAAALNIQTDAASKGEGSMRGLSLAVGDLERVLAAVLSQGAKLDAFEKSIQRVSDATSGYEKAKADLDAFKASIEGVTKPTSEQEATLKRLQVALSAASKESNNANRQFATQSAAMAKLGVDTTNLTQAQQTNAASLLQVSTAYRQANTAQIEFSANRAKAKAEIVAQQKAEADFNAFLKKAADEEIARQAAIAKAKQDAYKLDKQVNDSQAALDRQRETALKAQEAEQAELNRLRKIAQDALASTAPSGLGASPEATQQINSASQALANILAPAAQARATLAGVEAEVTSLGKAADSGEKKTAALTRSLLDTAEQSKRALQTQAQLIDSYRNQERATLAAATAGDTAFHALEKLEKELAAATAPSKELSAQLTKAKADLAAATAEYEKQNVTLTRLRQGLAGAGIDYAKLDEASGKVNAAAISLTKTIKTLDDTLEQGDKKSESRGFSILGLRPDQLSNVEHELSHAFDQIASGGSPFRAFLEQSGKLLFNFQNGLSALTPYVGALVVSIPILALAFGALSHAIENAGSARDFENRLKFLNETTVATGHVLTDTARDIQHFGVTFEDARKGVDTFLQSGLNPRYFVELGDSADKLSVAFGISFPDAAKKLATGLTTGLDGFKALNNEFGIFSPAQAQLIIQTYEQGRTNDAMALTLEAVRAKTKEVGDEARGPAALAFIQLKNAYHDLVETIANNKVIGFLIGQLGDLARAVNTVLNLGGGQGPGALAQGIIDSNEAKIAAQKKQLDEISKLRVSPENAGGQHNAELDKEEADRKKQIADLEAINNKIRESTGLKILDNQAGQQASDQLKITTDRQQVLNQLEIAEEELQRLSRADRRAKGQEAIDLDNKRNEALEKTIRLRLQAQGIDTQDPAVAARIAREVDEQKRRLDEARARQQAQDDQAIQSLELKTAEAQAAGLKGAAKVAAQKKVIDIEVEQELTRLASAEGLTRQQAAEKFATQIAAFRISKEGEVQRQVDAQGAAAGQKALKAEEGLVSQLLALKEKLNNKDKTDLDARLKGIEEEYAKRQLLVDSAKRRGAGTTGNVDLNELQAELDAAHQKEIQNVTIESQEAQLNSLLKQRKEAYAAIADAVKSGAISVDQGFTRASDVTSRLGKQLKDLVTDALAFAKSIAGANPSPKLQEYIQKLELLQKQPAPGAASSGGQDASPSVTDNGADKVTQAALERINQLSKERNDIETAYHALQKDGLVNTETSEEKTKEAYDRTSPQIKQIIQDTQTHLDQLKQLGQIGPAAYDLATAELTKYAAQAQYASQNQKELVQGIESSVLNRATAGFEGIATAIGKVVAGQGNLKTITTAVAQAFASFAAGILQDIAKIIIKQILLAQISAVVAYLTGGASTGFGAGGASAVAGAGAAAGTISGIGDTASAGVSHAGSIVGQGTQSTRYGLNASMFANAPRFHSGTVVGLASDEQTAIVQNGEEILSKDNPRNILNGGASTQPAATPQKGLKQVLVFDQKDLAGALAGSHGEDVTLTHIRNNTAAIRTMLG